MGHPGIGIVCFSSTYSRGFSNAEQAEFQVAEAACTKRSLIKAVNTLLRKSLSHQIRILPSASAVKAHDGKKYEVFHFVTIWFTLGSTVVYLLAWGPYVRISAVIRTIKMVVLLKIPKRTDMQPMVVRLYTRL